MAPHSGVLMSRGSFTAAGLQSPYLMARLPPQQQQQQQQQLLQLLMRQATASRL